MTSETGASTSSPTLATGLNGYEAIGELDLAIRDVRNVVFDHCRQD